MAGEEAGRRGIPSLLYPSSYACSEGQQEYIVSDVTQVRQAPCVLFLLSRSSFCLPFLGFLFRLPACLLGLIRPHERLIVRGRRFLQLIGWTPLIELKRIGGKDGVDARIIGKAEAYQPLCSVKDRCALRSNLFYSFLPYWLGNSDRT